MAIRAQRGDHRRISGRDTERVGALSVTLFDSNILIDALNGTPEAHELIAASPDPAISILTWMEVLVGAKNQDVESATRTFLNDFTILQLTGPIAEASVQVRRSTRLKLVDATILATARVSGRELLTRNTKDFDASWPGVTIPYAHSR
ncbi:hypothetical protein AYO38_00630 [bacterium SCGC AG-212-C10]|nr:hypothetical protein AYO38_00630 [bacterium SCGC AG-212-C10]